MDLNKKNDDLEIKDRLKYLEDISRWNLFALDLVASLGDLQTDENSLSNPNAIFQIGHQFLERLIQFKNLGFYTVDETNGSFKLAYSSPQSEKESLENIVDGLKKKGTFAWALNINRAIVNKAENGQDLVLHSLATKKRVRGLFVGVLPDDGSKLDKGQLHLLSIIIHYVVGEYESNSLYALLKEQNDNLETLVKQRTSELDEKTKILETEFEEHKKVLKDLAVSEESQRAIINSALDAVVNMDVEKGITGWNKRAEEIFGWKEEEILGSELSETIIPSAYRDAHNVGVENFMATGKGPVLNNRIEIVGLHQDGHEFPIELSVTVSQRDQRTVFTAFIRDLTGSQKTQEELESLIRKNESILNSAGEGIYGIDLKGIVTFCNPAASKMVGYKVEELTGNFYHSMIHHSKSNGIPYPKEESPILSVFQDGSVRHITDEVFWKKDGSCFPVEYVCNPIRENRRVIGAVITFKDVTERTEMNIKLQEATQAAQSANRAKSEFLANTSHEIRTPLNAITGFSNILLKLYNQNKISEKFKEYLEIIVKSGENLTEVINNVLDLSKIESGKMDVIKEAFDLKVVIKSIYAIFKKSIHEKGVILNYEFDENIKNYILSDRIKLNQILTNLLGNAQKFTHSGEINLEVKTDGKFLVFTVSDTGIGMPEDRLKAIFNPFEQVDSSTTRRFGGSGLGLALTKKLVELLNGDIWVESEIEKGSVFGFKIPWEEVQKEEEELGTTDTYIFKKNYKILLVEDNEENLLLTKFWLDEMGLPPRVARNGKEALDLVQEEKPDLIFMDVQMPVMDGLEATKILKNKEETKNIPIVGLSAHALKEHKQEGIEAGFNDYLTKPLQEDLLIEVCKKHLEN
jgi:PAS domain S-box-containing protein